MSLIYTEDSEAFYVTLREFVAGAGFSQRKLAELVGMSRAAVGVALRGDRRVDFAEWLLFCRVLGVTPEKFLRRFKVVRREL